MYNEKGETLLSVLLAAAISMAVMVVVVPGLIKMTSYHELPNSFKECRVVASGILDRIKSNGIQAKIHNSSVTEDSFYLDSASWHSGNIDFNNNNIISEFGALKSKRWPHKKVIAWNSTDNLYDSNSPYLIQGSINSLLSLYNSDPGFCNSIDGVQIKNNNLLQNLKVDTFNNKKFEAFLKITPYNIFSEASESCVNNLKIRPPASQEPPPAENANIFKFQDFEHDKGLEVSILVKLESSAPTVQGQQNGANCTVKTRFQYDQKNNNPLPPIASYAGSVYNFQKAFASQNPGTQLLCKEEHFYYYYEYKTGFLGTQRRVRKKGSNVETDWKICDKITVCGNTPQQTSIDQQNGVIDLTFQTHPTLCRSSMKVKTVDVYGNTSDNITLARATVNPPCVGPCGNTPTPPPPNERNPSSSSNTSGYVVAGVQFSNVLAAQKASNLTGLPVETTTNVGPITADSVMNLSQGTLNSLSTTSANLQTLADNVNAIASGATGLTPAQLSGGVALSATTEANAITNLVNAENYLQDLRNNLTYVDSNGVTQYSQPLGDVIGAELIEQAEMQASIARAAAEQAGVASTRLALEAAARALADAQLQLASAQASLSSCQANKSTSCSTNALGVQTCTTVTPPCNSQKSAVSSAQSAVAAAQAALAAATSARDAAENAYVSTWDGV